MVQIHSPRPLHRHQIQQLHAAFVRAIGTGFRCESCDTLRNIQLLKFRKPRRE